MSKEEIIKELEKLEEETSGFTGDHRRKAYAEKILELFDQQNQQLLEKMTELRDLRKEEKGKSLDYWEGYTKARNEDINQLLK